MKMRKYKVIAYGYYYGENYPAIIMECDRYWACSKEQVRRDFIEKMRNYDICINRVKVSVRP